jgi:hypothetical protein
MGSKKRSRAVQEPAEPIRNEVDWESEAAKKKTKLNADQEEEEEDSDKVLLPVETLTEQITNEDFRIVAGSYERILYGVNAFWETQKDNEVNIFIGYFLYYSKCIAETIVRSSYHCAWSLSLSSQHTLGALEQLL